MTKDWKNISFATKDEKKRERVKDIVGTIRTKYGIRSDDVLLMALELLMEKSNGEGLK